MLEPIGNINLLQRKKAQLYFFTELIEKMDSQSASS